MFLEGTLYIFLIYLVILVAVIIFPVVFKNKFDALVNYFNRKEFQSRNLSYLLLILGIGLIISSSFVISLFNRHLFDILEGWWGFHFFATFAFTLLPIGIGLVCAYGFIRNTNSVPQGTFFLFLLCFFCFGFAATNLHDVLWCGTRTGWFAFDVSAGYDLDLWINLFQSPSDDYRIFGFYMGVQVVIFCVYALVNLWRYLGRLPVSARRLQIKIGFITSIIIGCYGVSIYIFDYPKIFGPIPTFITVWIMIPLLAFPSYLTGKYFNQLNQIHLKTIQNQ